MLDRFVYLLAAGIISAIRKLPLGVCFALGQALGLVLWLILPRYRKLAKENIASVFGSEMTPGRIRRLVFSHFVTMGANMVSALKIPAMTEEEINRVVVVENAIVSRQLISRGRGAIVAVSHIGNWELFAQLFSYVRPARGGAVYQSQSNKAVDDLVTRDRNRQGLETFDRKKGFNGAMGLLRDGGLLGVLVDQHAGDSGVWTPLFNRLCSTSPLAATLALRTGAPVFAAAIYTVGFARWRVVAHPEIPWSADNPNQLTADINRVLESQIRESPKDWFWVHNRWKTPLPNFLCANTKRGVFLPPDCDVAGLRPFRTVVRSSNWLGDAVMSVPTVRAFKGRPDARLTVLTPAKLAGLWKLIPEVDEIIEIADGESVFATAAKIRGRFDAAVLMPNSLRSALEVWLAGIPRRVGYAGHSRERLLNQVIRGRHKNLRPPEHHSWRYWRIADHSGGVRPEPLPAAPRPAGPKLVVGICPGAEYGPAKRWPAEKFRAAMQLLAAEKGCRFVIFGTAADSEAAAKILDNLNVEAEDRTGKTSLGELITELRQIHLLITNDTGTMHLADLLGVPLLAIFGSTEPVLTGPTGPHSRVIRHQVECSPCFLRDCPIDFRCMEAVTPEEVARIAAEMLAV